MLGKLHRHSQMVIQKWGRHKVHHFVRHSCIRDIAWALEHLVKTIVSKHIWFANDCIMFYSHFTQRHIFVWIRVVSPDEPQIYTGRHNTTTTITCKKAHQHVNTLPKWFIPAAGLRHLKRDLGLKRDEKSIWGLEDSQVLSG